jgi:histidinol-phosphate/aromatic aminotransferase/cobyric acid decarboxylase-like protein
VAKCVDERTRLVFIANPANPTGTWLTGEEIRALHAALPPSVVLVLDGAYAEFCTDPRFEDGLDLARTAENVIVTRTFSKIHGLAALRVGWGYGPATSSSRSSASVRRSTPRSPARKPPSPPWPTTSSRPARWPWSSSGGRG